MAAAPGAAPRVHLTRKAQPLPAGHLNLAAGARATATLGLDAARKQRVTRGPQHRLATAAVVGRGADIDHRAGLHVHLAGLQQGAAALPAAAYEHLAAGLLAVRVKACVGQQRHLAGGGLNGAAQGSGSIGRASDRQARATVAAQRDQPRCGGHRRGLDGTTEVDDVVQHPLHGGRAQQHLAAAGHDLAAVVNPGSQRLALHVLQLGQRLGVQHDVDQAVSGQVQHESVTGRQRHAAQVGLNHAAVGHLRPQQGDQAAVGHGDSAFVAHAGARLATAAEAEAAGHEVGVGQRGRAGHQATHVHLRRATKEDAVGVEQHHLPVGADAPEDGRRVLAQHPVERHRARAGLHELHGFLRAHVERAPINGRPVAGLRDGGLRALLLDLRLAGGDAPSLWGSVSQRQAQHGSQHAVGHGRQQRREGGCQCAGHARQGRAADADAVLLHGVS